MLTRREIWIFAWLGAVIVTVGIGLIPGDYTGESLCGVWGCFPPVQALASLHLLWLLALAPPAVAVARRQPGTITRRAGVIVLICGALATRTDVPAIQLGLTGLFVMFAARRRPGRNEGDSDAAVAAGALDASGADSTVSGPRSLPSAGA